MNVQDSISQRDLMRDVAAKFDRYAEELREEGKTRVELPGGQIGVPLFSVTVEFDGTYLASVNGASASLALHALGDALEVIGPNLVASSHIRVQIMPSGYRYLDKAKSR